MNADELQPYIGVSQKVRLERGFPNEPLHNGFVLSVGATLVLMQQFHDFYNEGYTALRRGIVKCCVLEELRKSGVSC